MAVFDPIPHGSLVRITNTKSVYYGQTGVVVPYEATEKGWYVRHDDGEIVFHPWGIDVIRRSDTQYRAALRFILHHGEAVQDTPQGVPAITSFEVPKMVFDLQNGFPLITERDMSKFWKKPINELFAFLRGARTNDELLEAGCDFWTTSTTPEKCAQVGLEPGDLGPGSYGAAFHNFPMPNGGTFNQIDHLINQIRGFPHLRTHFISPWIPFYIGRGGYQKAVTSPCHGWIHVRILNGKLILHMYQRSADMPIGVPNNIVQYAALTMALASLLGYKAWKYVHSFSDAHIYANQTEKVEEIIGREPRVFPTMVLKRRVEDIYSVTADDFELTDYNPHPAIRIPFIP